MKIQVTDDPASLEAARADAARTGRDPVAAFLDFIRDQVEAEEPWIFLSDIQESALARGREEFLPKLLAMTRGHAGEAELLRLFAAVALGKLDAVAGFRALLPFLNAESSGVLIETLDRLRWAIETAGDRADLALADLDYGRVVALLDHPDRYVAHYAVRLLGTWRPPGAAEVLQSRVDDPRVGWASREELADIGRDGSILRHAFEVLARSADEKAAKVGVDLIRRFHQSSPDLSLRAEASDMLAALEALSNLPEAARDDLSRALTKVDRVARAEAARLAAIEQASADVERIIAAGLVDRAEGDAALAAVRGTPCPEFWVADSGWGARAAFTAAGVFLYCSIESGESPPPHDELLRDLAGVSRGGFAPEAILQTSIAEADTFPVPFIHRGRLYRFPVVNQGEWFDTDAILAAANLALADSAQPRRFVRLEEYGGLSKVAFADPVRLLPIADSIGLDKASVPTPGSVAAESRASLDRAFEQLRGFHFPLSDRYLSDADFGRLVDDNGRTALHFAAEGGDRAIVEALLAAGADPNAFNHRGATPLHHAAERGHVKLIEPLLAAGANLDAADLEGWTPLHMAANSDRTEFVAALLDRGAILRARDNRGLTPLHIAASSGSPEIAALLIGRGTPVDIASIGVSTRSIEAHPAFGKSLPLREMMAWAGWHLGGKVEEGQTPLHRASGYGGPDVARLLIDRGADVNAVDARGQTPLHLAVAQNNPKVADLLRDRGADPTLRDLEGRTPDERLGDRDAQWVKIRKGLRRLFWLIRLIQVASFPFRLVARFRERFGGPVDPETASVSPRDRPRAH